MRKRGMRLRVVDPLRSIDSTAALEDESPDVRSWKSVGEIMGMKPGTCQAIGSRALRKLRLVLLGGMTPEDARKAVRRGEKV